MRNFVGQWYHVKQWQNYSTATLKNVFSNAKKMPSSRNIFRHFFRAFRMFVLLPSNHTVFLVQFEIKLKIALAEAAREISAFWKTHSCKLIPNWTRNRIMTYTKCHSVGLGNTPQQLPTEREVIPTVFNRLANANGQKISCLTKCGQFQRHILEGIWGLVDNQQV